MAFDFDVHRMVGSVAVASRVTLGVPRLGLPATVVAPSSKVVTPPAVPAHGVPVL